MGDVVEVMTVDEGFTREASVLAEEVRGAGFLSLAEVVDSLVAEIVSLKVILEDEVVETGVATAAGVNVGPFEVAVKVAEVVEEEVGAVLISLALVAEGLDLVMVKEV